MNEFTVELKDLYPGLEYFTLVTVFYECGELCAQPVQDEYGREWSLKELSIYDLQVIEKNFVLNLLADQMGGLEWRPF